MTLLWTFYTTSHFSASWCPPKRRQKGVPSKDYLFSFFLVMKSKLRIKVVKNEAKYI